MFLLKKESSKSMLSTVTWVLSQSALISAYWLAARVAYVVVNGKGIRAIISAAE